MPPRPRPTSATRATLLGAAICLLAAPRIGSAQERAAVGAQVGYGRADLIGESSTAVSSRQGAITGVYLHLPFTGMFSLRPEVLFSLKGGQTLAQIQGTPDIALVDIELAYLELPLLVRATLPRGKYRPAIFGGPSLGLQIGCNFLFIADDDDQSHLRPGQPQR